MPRRCSAEICSTRRRPDVSASHWAGEKAQEQGTGHITHQTRARTSIQFAVRPPATIRRVVVTGCTAGAWCFAVAYLQHCSALDTGPAGVVHVMHAPANCGVTAASAAAWRGGAAVQSRGRSRNRARSRSRRGSRHGFLQPPPCPCPCSCPCPCRRRCSSRRRMLRGPPPRSRPPRLRWVRWHRARARVLRRGSGSRPPRRRPQEVLHVPLCERFRVIRI
jgi:hypothetical protein